MRTTIFTVMTALMAFSLSAAGVSPPDAPMEERALLSSAGDGERAVHDLEETMREALG